jgi:ABC-type nitrate/sulfonate/bicarbonate transport system substrate-binding protein
MPDHVFSGAGPGRIRALRKWLLFASLMCLTGCGGPEPPPVTLRVGVFAVQDLLPYFVIREQGFDRANGLRFEEETYAGGAAAIDAMAAGAIDMSPVVGSVPILVAAERGLIPGKIVPVAGSNFADPDHPGIGVVAANSSAGWKGLRGKKVAINARNSITTAAVAGRLKLEGVDDYSLVEIPFANMGLAVAGGNVAAAGMNEPFLTQSLLRRDGQLLGWVVGGPPLERAPVTSIVFRGDYLRGNPQIVKACAPISRRSDGWPRAPRPPARSWCAG